MGRSSKFRDACSRCLFRAVCTGTRPGLTSAIRAGRGGGDAGSLLSCVLPPELGASRGRIWTDTYVKHTVRTTTNTPIFQESVFWIENVAVIEWCCASPHVVAEFGSGWCVHKETSHGAVVPSQPFMKFDSTRVPSWDVTPSLHSRGETFAGSVTEFKGKLPAFLGSENFTCSA